MITHMYKIVGRLEPAKIAKYDYLMNFSVWIESKVALQKAIENACDYSEFKTYLSK
jgi:hypothetical protein